MKDFANKYLNWYNGLDKIVKVLLCLLWDVPSNLYRLSKSALKDSTLGIVLAIVIAIFGGWILFVVDIVCLALKEHIYWLDDFGIEEKSSCSCGECHCDDCNCDEKVVEPTDVETSEANETHVEE